MTRELYIQQHTNLFWYTPADKKKDVSDALLVETILNYGKPLYKYILTIITNSNGSEVRCR